jgi:hypothetical protein
MRQICPASAGLWAEVVKIAAACPHELQMEIFEHADFDRPSQRTD